MVTEIYADLVRLPTAPNHTALQAPGYDASVVSTLLV